MKKILFFAAMLMMTACGQRSNNNAAVDIADVEETTPADTVAVEPVKKQSQADFLRWCNDNGMDAFSFNRDGYLVYTVARSNISADPDWVAQQYYELAADVEGIKGCIVVDYADEELGRYER